MGNSCTSNNNVKIEEPSQQPTKKAGEDESKNQKPDDVTTSKDTSPVAGPSKKDLDTIDKSKNDQSEADALSSKKKEKEGTVKIVITEAVTEPVPQVEETYAEILVTDILAAAQQKAKDKRAAHKKALETMPPFYVRMQLHKRNKFQKKIEDLLLHDDENKEIVMATGVEDPIKFIHEISQNCINDPKKWSKSKPLLLLSKKDKKEGKKLLAALIAKETAEKSTTPPPPSSKSPPPSIPAEFLKQIVAIHDQSVEELKPIFDLAVIHSICQNVINGQESLMEEAILISPAMAKETREFFKKFLADSKNHETTTTTPQTQNVPKGPPSLSADLIQKIMETHEKCQKIFLPPPPLEQIHRVCQKIMLNQKPNWPAIFVSRSDKEEARSLLTNLVNFETKLREIDQKPPATLPTPPESLIQGVWRSHQLAVGFLTGGEKEDLKENGIGGKEIDMEILGKNIIQLHHAAQFSMHGVQPPVTSMIPIIENAAQKNTSTKPISDKKNPVDMSPMPPHVFRQLMVKLHKIHLLSQESLGGLGAAQKTEAISPPAFKYEETRDSGDYASLESFTIDLNPPPEKNQGFLQTKSPHESEPLYAKVNKRPLTPMVSFDDSPKNLQSDDDEDDEMDGEAIRMGLQKRKPTGVFLGQNKIKLSDVHSSNLDRTIEESPASSSSDDEKKKEKVLKRDAKKPLVKRDTWIKQLNGGGSTNDDRVREIEVQDKNAVPPTPTRNGVRSLMATFEKK